MVTIPGLEEIAQDPEFQFLFTAIAIMVTSISFFYPTYFRRKTALSRGLTETIRTLENSESRNARTTLLLKYTKNIDIHESELKKSTERVRNDLLLVQNLFEEKALPHKTFQSLYSVKMVSIIKAYEKFMKEYYPSLQVEPQIQKLYKNSYKWYAVHTKKTISKNVEGHIEDLWDKIGL